MKYTIEDSTLTAVADKLRETSGETEPITPEKMPEKIGGVFEAGVKSEYDRFWDTFQLNGTRRNYPRTFAGSGWTDDIFNPKYEIIVNNSAALMFNNNSQITTTKVHITINVATASASIFAGCTDLVTIPSLTITSKTTSFSGWFNSCGALEHIGLTEESVISASDFDVSPCPKLTHDSLRAIINALEDKSENTSGTQWKVILGDVNLAKLSEYDIAIAEEKGWVLA